MIPHGDILPTDWHAVRPMITDPKAEKYRDTWAYAPMMACNQTYTKLVDATYRSFNGEPALLGEEAVPKMFELRYRPHRSSRTARSARPSSTSPRPSRQPSFLACHPNDRNVNYEATGPVHRNSRQ